MAVVGGQIGQTKESRLKIRKQILDWFNKAIKKGPVSTSQIQTAFPEKSIKLIMESIGDSNYKKLTRATPVTTKINKEINKIVDDVVANKKPLVNASAQKIYAKVYNKPFNIKTDNVKTVTNILNKNPKFEKIKEKVRLAATRVGAKNEVFEKVLLKDFDKANTRTKLPRVSGQIVEESILRDLDRHIGRNGKDFKYVAGGKTNSYKTLKIKDVKNGDILTFDKIKEAIKKGDPRFKEYNKVFNDMKTLKNTPYVNPVSGEKITLLKGLQSGTGIDSPLHLQHNKGIKESPLKNLSISSHKANQGARIVKSADDLKTLGIKGTLPGGKKVYGPDLNLDDNINRFTKFADKMIKGAGTRTLKTPTETLLNIGKNIGKAKTAIPAAIGTYLMTGGNEVQAGEPIYNNEIGAFVKAGTDDVASQSGLLDWASKNPETLAVGGTAMTKTGSTLLKGLLKTLAAPAVGVANAAYEISENLESGDNIVEAVADKTAGLGLMGSSAFSGGLGKLMGGAKIARSLTPVGAAMTGAGIAKDYYDFTQEEIERMNAMTDYDREVYNEMLMDDTNIDF